MSSDLEPTDVNQIHTSGGASVEGAVDTAGGNFVGRDNVTTSTGDIHIHHYASTPPAAAASDDDAPAPGAPPYQGMAYYDVADADRFFGREALTVKLIDHLRQQPLLAVVGASGSGKSSLVRAGVLPALQGKQPLIDGKQPPTGSARWAYHLITPTARPLESLAASLTRSSESVTATSTLIDDLRRDPRSLQLYARRLVSGEQRLVLLVDQFEELFTLCKDRAERQAFVENLLYAVQPAGVVTLIVTLRADFYHHCADFPALRTALETQQRYIGAMTPDELRRAITEPANAAHWSFQPGLVEQLLHDVGDEPGALPLLSHALLETWQRRRGRTLTLAGYRAAGGVQGAIAKSADDVFNRFTDEQKTIARILFLRLTELGEGVQDTRRRVRPAELKLTQANPDAVHQVLKTLADARLVTTDEDEVQVAHEALIRHWATLRAWLDDDREGHRIQRRLTEAANQWVEFGKEPALLYRGVLLQQAQVLLQNTIDPPNQIEMEFLHASQAEAEAEAMRAANLAAERERNRQNELENQRQLTIEQSRRAQIFLNAVAVAGLLFLLAVIAAGISYYLNGQLTKANNSLRTTNAELDHKNDDLNKNNQQLDDTVNRLNRTVNELDITNGQLQQAIVETQRLADIAFSRQLAAQSTRELNNDNYELAILLAIEAGRTSDTVEAFSSIRAAMNHSDYSRFAFYGHTGRITTMRWNNDESKILTSSVDGTTRIWNANTGEELIKFKGQTGSVFQAEWNNDESRVLTIGNDNTARIWDAATGMELMRFIGHTDRVGQAMWNNDESRILTGSTDNTARIWDAVTGVELVKFVGHTDSVWQVMWNNDESRIVTGSIDNTVRIWDAVTGIELIKLEGANYAKLNKNESKILTGSFNNNAYIWNFITGEELVKIDGHTAPIWETIWNKDESKILTGSEDTTARMWDAATGKELITLQGHTDSVRQVTLSKDESKILTSSEDNTVRIWNATTGEELIKFEGIGYFSQRPTWNKDESKILMISKYDTAGIWDVTTGDELAKIDGHEGLTTEAIWNQAESRILTNSSNGTIKIWYIDLEDLLLAACQWTPRNFTWVEWSDYMEENIGAYRPTCPNIPIPTEVLEGIQ